VRAYWWRVRRAFGQRECPISLAATIREPLGNLEQRTQEQIGRFKIEASDRDQTAEIAQMMDSQCPALWSVLT
jgi:hypothetical protein